MSRKENTLRRRRIFKETVIKGQLVAKSYVNLDFRKTFTEQVIYYTQISYTIVDRQLLLRTE